MSLDSQAAGSLVARQMLASASCANTAAATSGSGFWIDTRDLEGEIVVVANIGAVTGSIAGKLQSATDNAGTGAADITGATFGAVSSANGMATITITKNQMTARYLGFVGTIVTGPVVVGVHAVGATKYV